MILSVTIIVFSRCQTRMHDVGQIGTFRNRANYPQLKFFKIRKFVFFCALKAISMHLGINNMKTLNNLSMKIA